MNLTIIIRILLSLNDLKKRIKRSRVLDNGQAVNLFVETLIVTDKSVFIDHQRYTKSADPNVVFEHMRIYFSFIINGVGYFKNVIIFVFWLN